MYQNYDNDYQAFHETEQPNSLSKAAMVMGILALFTVFTGYLAVIFGSLGVIFACLSHGRKKMNKNAKLSLGISLAGFVAGICVVIYSFIIVFSNGYNLDTFLKQYYQQYYEEDYDQEENESEDTEPASSPDKQTSPIMNNNGSVQL